MQSKWISDSHTTEKGLKKKRKKKKKLETMTILPREYL